MLLIQTFSVITLFYFSNTFNILTTWYLAGIYLILLGWLLLLDDGDIFVGFLWVIDLGVGLIFFIFILHYMTFLHQKSNINKTSREFTFSVLALMFMFSVFSFISSSTGIFYTLKLSQTWVFSVSWYDYYDFFYFNLVTDLNLLHEIYFTHNSFEFFLINFFLLYGIIASILLSFSVKRFFNLMNYHQLSHTKHLDKPRSTFFIRSQDYLKQQSVSAGTRVWLKKKHPKV